MGHKTLSTGRRVPRMLALAAIGLAGTLLAGPALAGTSGGTGAVTAGARVISGPDIGSTTQVAAGDQARWALALDPQDVLGPSQTTTFALTGAQQLVAGTVLAPPSTSVLFSDDGSTYGATESSASRYVRVTGPVAERAAGAVLALNGPGASTISGSSGGDGYGPVLTDTRVFNVFHHGSLRVDCHVIATGALCAGYPYDFFVGTIPEPPATGHAPRPYIDDLTGHLWVAAQRMDPGHETEIGFACVDVALDDSMPTDCGWVAAGDAAPYWTTGTGAFHSGAAIGRRLFSLDNTGKVYCLDAAANNGAGGTCSGYPVDLGLSAAGGNHLTALSPVGNSTRLIARTNSPSGVSTLACIDTATGAACAGWGAGAAGLRAVPTTNNTGGASNFRINGDVLPVQSNGTAWDAFCGVRNQNAANNPYPNLAITCWNLLDGSTRAVPPGLDTVTGGNTGFFFGYEGVNRPDTVGHRVYFTMLLNWDQGDRLVCYDYAANSGAGGVCPNYPNDLAEPSGSSLRTYATALDTTGTCVWTLGDAGLLGNRSAADPAQGCATSSSQIAVTPADAYCGDDQSGQSWAEVALRGLDPTADFATGFVTLRGSDGAIVPGFSHVAVPANGRIDISSIPKSGATASLSVTAIFGGIDIAKFQSGDALLQATWSGSAMPMYCFDTVPVTSCSTMQDMQVDSTTTFTGAVSGAGLALPASASLTRTDPAAADCAAATIVVEACSSGVISDCDPSDDGLWSANATILQNLQTTFRVSLTNAGTATLNGVVVTPSGLSACSHAIASLAPAADQVWTCSAPSVIPGVDEQVAVTANATCPSEGCRTVSVQSSAAHIAVPAVPAADAVTSAGPGMTVQTSLLALPAGGSVMLLDADGNAVTLLVIADQGTYALDSGTGAVSFAPVSGFVGTATPVQYRVSDAWSQTAVGTYTPTVTIPAQPTAQPVTSTGPAGAGQQQTIVIPPGATLALLDSSGAAAQVVTVAGEGTYALDPTNGIITFTPQAAFHGTATGISYRITDAYGQSVTATYVPTVISAPVVEPPVVVPGKTPKPSLQAARLSVMSGTQGRIVPVHCRLSSGRVARCDVSLEATVAGRRVVVGRGSTLVRGAGVPGPVRVAVTLTPLGRALAQQPGGVRAQALARIRSQSSAAWLPTRARTRVVAASSLVPHPVLFDTASAVVRPAEMRYLRWLRGKLAGATRVSCVGYTDNRNSPGSNVRLGAQRADAVCEVLKHGGRRSATTTRGETTPFAPNTTPAGMQLNRRTEITLTYR